MRSFTSYSPHYCSLYRLDPDALPFEANLLACRPAVDPPTYLLSQLTVGETASSRSAADRYDFRSVLPQVEAQTGQGGWRLLSKWPELHKGGATTMDEAQAAALRVALTKEVAIVAGGPATGKQYLSRVILRALLDNRGKRGDGATKPVLLVSPASHTLDRALAGVVGFEPNVVRVASTRAEGLKAHNLSAKVREVKGDDAHAAAVAKVSKKLSLIHI